MGEESAEATFYKPDTWYTAEGVIEKLTDKALDDMWLDWSKPDQSGLPDWAREPVWIIEIKVRRA